MDKETKQMPGNVTARRGVHSVCIETQRPFPFPLLR